MSQVIFLSIPGLRQRDLQHMPRLCELMAGGESASLSASFPAVTWPIQANMLTGKTPDQHGVIGNGFFWRESCEVEMWTAWNDKIEAPQIWDRLHEQAPKITSAVWFPMLSKGCGADYVCMPAPIHNPDGSEDLWCYTKPTDLYGELRDRLGHFPLQHFWGPLAGIPSTAWIVDSAIIAAQKYRPRFFFLYLPHLDYAAQKNGPDSESAVKAIRELDKLIARLATGFQEAYGDDKPIWLAASEYAIVPVDHVVYPNRVLRAAGLLDVTIRDGCEYLDLKSSRAWALVDHQFSHVFVRDADSVTLEQIRQLFAGSEGVDAVLIGDERSVYHLDHPRSGEVVLISSPNSWQAYYWWEEDDLAPSFARTVDIHRKPGYDPVELHFDPATKSIPLDANLVRGSHGAPVRNDSQRGILLTSQSGILPGGTLVDTDVADIVLRQFH